VVDTPAAGTVTVKIPKPALLNSVFRRDATFAAVVSLEDPRVEQSINPLMRAPLPVAGRVVAT
jgi:hypothetical protein